MKSQHSSRNRYRVLFGLWCAIGIALLTAAFSPQQRRRGQNLQAVAALNSACDALAQAKQPGSDAAGLFSQAQKSAEESVRLFGSDQPDAVLAAKVELALIDIEAGRAIDALSNLEELVATDRPKADSPWTRNTFLIEAALAEARYKIAVTCRTQGDGYENWSKYAEAAARSYQQLANRAPEAEKAVHLKNLATCTRLIHGGPDSNHSLGLPSVPVPDCPVVLRIRKRPPPPHPNDEPWQEPQEPDENTEGR